MLWSSKFPQDADFGSWKDDDYPKTPDGWNGQSLGTVVVLWPKRSPEVEQRARKVLGKATASAQNVFDEALTSARKVYDEAVASAGKAREEAEAPARKAYEEAVALAGIDYNLILAENLPLLLDPPPSRIVLYRADTDKWVETPDPQEASRFASLAVWEHQKFVEKLIGGQKEVRKAFEGGEPMRFGRRRSVFVKSYTRRRRALF